MGPGLALTHDHLQLPQLPTSRQQGAWQAGQHYIVALQFRFIPALESLAGRLVMGKLGEMSEDKDRSNPHEADGETARMFYESARSELIARIGLRDGALVAYLGAVGAIFGVALGSASHLPILLVVPFLALGAEFVISQHTEIIGAISNYCSAEIAPLLTTKSNVVPQWDNSKSLAAYSKSAVYRRTYGNIALICLPAVMGLTIIGSDYQKYILAWQWETVAWWVGVILVLLALLIERRAHVYRRNKFAQTFPNE